MSEHGTGMKFDGDKVRMELLIQGMPRALYEVAKVLTFGAEKYEAHSWQHVPDGENRYWGAKLRHDILRAMGEECDEESKLLHLAHEACDVLFLLELELRKAQQPAISEAASTEKTKSEYAERAKAEQERKAALAEADAPEVFKETEKLICKGCNKEIIGRVYYQGNEPKCKTCAGEN